MSGLVVVSSVMLFVFGRCDVVGEEGIGVVTNYVVVDILSWIPVSAFVVAGLGEMVLMLTGECEQV
jgi:hypothetical protein